MELSEKEKAVVHAMRMGGEVRVYFHDSSYENAMANADASPCLTKGCFFDLRERKVPYLVFSLRDENKDVDITHFINCSNQKGEE